MAVERSSIEVPWATWPLAALLLCILFPGALAAQGPARARDLGIIPGILQPGPLNAITDVPGVRVGQTTVRAGDSVRTGVTAILPHAGNAFLDRVPAAIHVGNGFGKLLGVDPGGRAGRARDADPAHLHAVRLAGRRRDGRLAAGAAGHGASALDQPGGGRDQRRLRPERDPEPPDRPSATCAPRWTARASGPVAEGSVGAGTGTVAFGWKGGIGTSSRRAPAG